MFKTIDRITLFINHLGISVRKFDMSIGASNGYTLRMKKNRASVGSDMLERIAEKYPSISIDWLITGEGSMLRDNLKINLDKDLFENMSMENLEQKVVEKIKEKQKQDLMNLLKEIAAEIHNNKK
ncbi:MAG: hypothetical protein OIF50_04420 [Flavobacteriaceae bacterium]|nr:hypothetical protein [Flavobacteriaceae bacterium]